VKIAPGSTQQIKTPGTLFEGWKRVLLALGDDGRLWLLYVHRVHPEPPENFSDVGRPGNAPLYPPPEPSPRATPHQFPFQVPGDPPSD